MALKLVTAPDPAVTWAEADRHLRLDGDTTQQAYVESLIAAATAWIDGKNGWLGRAIMPQVWDLVWDEFPSGAIQIPLPPLIRVEGVFYVDADSGAEVEFAADQYAIDTASAPGWIVPASSWPTHMDAANAVRIRFTAGFGTIEGDGTITPALPAPIRSAILLLVGHLYAHRGDENQEMPRAAEFLLQPYKIWSI